MNTTTNLQDQETKSNSEEEEEDALSLSGFSLTPNEPEKKTHHHRRSSSQPPDFFEFSNDSTGDAAMCHAEDIISGGKLVPYKPPPPFDDRILKSATSEDYNSVHLSRRSAIRSSRSLDSRKFCRNPTRVSRPDIHRSCSDPGHGSRPRWYVLAFGIPPEMDLRDMKNRQVRRSLVPEVAGGGGSPVNRRSSWGSDLLRVLSCRDHPSVGVRSSICLVPQV